MKKILKVTAIVVVILLALCALTLYRVASYEAASCNRIQGIAKDSDLREYLTSWALESFGEPDSHRDRKVDISLTGYEFPEEIKSVGLEWSRLKINPEFATFAISQTTINADKNEEESYLLSIGEGRDEVLLLISAQPVTEKIAAHQNISPEYKVVMPGVWFYCD